MPAYPPIHPHENDTELRIQNPRRLNRHDDTPIDAVHDSAEQARAMSPCEATAHVFFGAENIRLSSQEREIETLKGRLNILENIIEKLFGDGK